MFIATRPGIFLNRSAQSVRLNHLFVLLAFLSLHVKQVSSTPNYLHTSGNKIVDASGKVVGLSGVNWFGFETELRAPHGLWQRNWQDMLDQVRDLGYNVIRLPFSNAMLDPGAKPTGINYAENPDLANLTALDVMDRIIAGAQARGIRVILDNHRSTSGGGPESNGLWYTSSYPESRWLDDWKMLANRYKGNDTVVGMDLRNEPFGACWGCGDPSTDWRLAAEKAGNAILSVNPELLIIVEGIANYNGQNTWWGGNLMGAKEFPVRLQVPNRLVYSPHEYPPSMYPQAWFSDPGYPDNLPAVWDKFWGSLAADTPILIGEFGTRLETDRDRQWLQKFRSYIQEKRLNWTFWSLNPNSGDTGGLLLDNWQSVQKEKQDLLKTIQYPFIGSDMQPSPSFPAPTQAPAATGTPLPQNIEARMLDDFESGDLQDWNTFRSNHSNVTASLVSPGRSGSNAMKIDYNIPSGGWGGVERQFALPQYWDMYQGIRFDVYGSNSGTTIRFEVLDNRMSGSHGDTAERFEYKFTDNFNGWRTFVLPWSVFVRRADWQPPGAPNDGFNLSAVWGLNFAPIHGQGSFQVDGLGLVHP
jgi:aryl-phospho-beta-D-glucosidase BglC (GH1 family)